MLDIQVQLKVDLKRVGESRPVKNTLGNSPRNTEDFLKLLVIKQWYWLKAVFLNSTKCEFMVVFIVSLLPSALVLVSSTSRCP
jgi:hypothetical protein